jgi:hypothetical protein
MPRRAVRIVAVLAVLLAIPLSLRAAPVDETAARGIAAGFLHRLDAAEVSVAGSSAIGGGLAFVVGLAPRGYVVVAGDDALPPVVAYSLESDCPDAAGNPLADLVAADLRSRLAALPALSASEAEARARAWADLAAGVSARDGRFTQWPPEGSTPTGGWIVTNWTQNAPYNALCPLDLAHGGTRSLAGCPAVAMAMILNYHTTVQGTVFGAGDRYYHNYAGNAYWIPDASAQYGFPSFTTLNGYLTTLTQHWTDGTTLTNNDKAALVFACGVAARQVYSASGSGTFGVSQAYAAFQRFAFAECRLVHDTDPNMYPDLAANMQNALPAHLAVVDPGWTMGHNLVVDGYNTDNYFHVNFGWGGSYNGWYLLPQEIPYGLTVIEGLILDIVPGTATAPDAPVASAFALTGQPNPSTARVTLSFTSPAAAHASLGVYDAAGRLQATVLDAEVGAGSRSIDWTPNRLPAGVYLLRLRLNGRIETRRLVLTR